MKSPASIGICMVATNAYIEHWKNTAKSLEENAFLKDVSVTIHLFTNMGDLAEEWSRSNLKRIKLKIHKVQGWGWPEATLFRYKFISQNQNKISEDFLLYLDSDMKIAEDFASEFFEQLGDSRIGFVQHPGFARLSGFKLIRDFVSNPRLINPHLKKILLRQKGIGSWEVDPNSTAYVEPKSRKNYVHGAIWGGERKIFLEMCEMLDKRIEDDLARDFIAVWHDESHLNWYFAKFGGALLDNTFSGYKKFKHLRYWPAKITTIEKSIGDGRTPTQEGLTK